MLVLSAALALSPAQQAVLDERLDAVARESAGRLGADASEVRAVLDQRAQTRLTAWPSEPTDEDLQRRIADFEALRLERYVTSGVFPKTYFGYFDTRGDTAEWEWELREHVQCVREALNAVVDDMVVTDLDLAVTFLAEGGTLMLDEPSSQRDRLHPVMDVGLDDLASGTDDLADLVEAVDTRCGSHLGEMVTLTPAGSDPPAGALGGLISKKDGKDAWLMRWADLRDAVAGTGVMWVWEVRIADRKLKREGRKRWADRDAVGRFIAGSLVYNSGILHNESTHTAIRDFSTGKYLYDRSERNAHRRPRLALQAPSAQLEEVLKTARFRDQWTSWVAVYHVLQRYGAWQALVDHTDGFDGAGNFVPRQRAVPLEPVEEEPRELPAAPSRSGCGCAEGPAPWELWRLGARFTRR